MIILGSREKCSVQGICKFTILIIFLYFDVTLDMVSDLSISGKLKRIEYKNIPADGRTIEPIWEVFEFAAGH